MYGLYTRENVDNYGRPLSKMQKIVFKNKSPVSKIKSTLRSRYEAIPGILPYYEVNEEYCDASLV